MISTISIVYCHIDEGRKVLITMKAMHPVDRMVHTPFLVIINCTTSFIIVMVI